MYPPSEDSYFLAEQLARYLSKLKGKNIKFLDLGTGSAIQAKTASRFLGKNSILCSDIGKKEVGHAKNLGFKSIQSDLFSKIRGKFNLISFNPPYLPESKYDKKQDTSGGKQGDELILRFLKQIKKHLAENGKIFLLLSSLTPRKRINKEIKNFKKKVVSRKKLFFEQLEIWEISN